MNSATKLISNNSVESHLLFSNADSLKNQEMWGYLSRPWENAMKTADKMGPWTNYFHCVLHVWKWWHYIEVFLILRILLSFAIEIRLSLSETIVGKVVRCSKQRASTRKTRKTGWLLLIITNHLWAMGCPWNYKSPKKTWKNAHWPLFFGAFNISNSLIPTQCI